MNINYDLDFNTEFGDLYIYNEEVIVHNNFKIYLINYINEKLKTCYNDIFNIPDYGSNLDLFLGKGIDTSLINDINSSIRNSLVAEGLLTFNDFEILSTPINKTLYIRIIVTKFNEEFSTGLQLTSEGGIEIV